MQPVIHLRRMHRKPPRINATPPVQKAQSSWVKEKRRICTSYDKLVSIFQAMVPLACIERCLRAGLQTKLRPACGLGPPYRTAKALYIFDGAPITKSYRLSDSAGSFEKNSGVPLSKVPMKSSSNNRLDAIIDGLMHASDMALKHADMPLARMPEFFMAMHVATHFAESFANFGYRLETSVKQTLAEAGVDDDEIADLLNQPELRGNGRFDLLLRTGRRGVPAHIMEFKRGSRSEHLLKDLIRLSYVARTVHAGSRLETNYLVFTTKKSEARLLSMLQEQEMEHSRTHRRARSSVVYRLKRYQEIPHWDKRDAERNSVHMAVAVFEVSYKHSGAAT